MNQQRYKPKQKQVVTEVKEEVKQSDLDPDDSQEPRITPGPDEQVHMASPQPPPGPGPWASISEMATEHPWITELEE